MLMHEPIESASLRPIAQDQELHLRMGRGNVAADGQKEVDPLVRNQPRRRPDERHALGQAEVVPCLLAGHQRLESPEVEADSGIGDAVPRRASQPECLFVAKTRDTEGVV